MVSPGKEHLLQINEEIGCYLYDLSAEKEDFDEPTLSGSMKAIKSCCVRD